MVAQAQVEASDLWYVAIAPGETKVLTLEQLDDWFRLEVIDADTKVWQPGMSEWLPLSVVAGIEEPPTRVAPPPSPRRTPSPPGPAAPNPFSVAPSAANPFSVAPSPPKPPPRPMTASGAPPPPSARVPSAPRPVALATAQTVPAPVVNGPWPVALSTSRSPIAPAPVESIRPHVMSARPMPAPRSGGAGGRVVMTLAILAGLGVTLYRNDVLRQAAVSAGQSANYQKLETALGGPGFGTPRAVEALVLPAASLSDAVQNAQTSSSTTRAKASSWSSTSSSSSSKSSGSSSTSSTPSTTIGSSSSSDRLKATSQVERRAPAPAAPARSKADAEPSRNLGIKGSSNKFDPLNGKL